MGVPTDNDLLLCDVYCELEHNYMQLVFNGGSYFAWRKFTRHGHVILRYGICILCTNLFGLVIKKTFIECYMQYLTIE